MKYCLIFLVTTLLNSNCSQGNCKIEKVEKIFSVYLKNNDVESYKHYVYIDNINKKCIDSATLIKSILMYRDTVASNRPVQNIEIYNSKKGYDPGETLGQPEEFYKNCIVRIWFNLDTGMPVEFYFFDRNGNITYKGTNWKP